MISKKIDRNPERVDKEKYTLHLELIDTINDLIKRVERLEDKK